ncbi:ABC transporter ATP-binding protein [Candidatus Viridilinea mediisalina]|uniref:ABC transporter domain-containing protein n=1 Tax=Candidatus Viridilinea mediisalina TaxID=2024553 RepID=A0A2A6RCU5_9CHLR|nr:ABC transporter ATP-binding protein [Candidatus Viridilinea mediisalina]PDV98644.1 hypothetical protein CJ255_21850 [Candidatus Viridilinea mediisalina]
MQHLLTVNNLAVTYQPSDGPPIRALSGVSFTLELGHALGVMGESGSGKTTLARALIGLLPTASVTGQIGFEGQPLPLGHESALRLLRWRKLALAFQGSSSAFDPVYPVGEQVIDPLREHLGLARAAARQRALELWAEVGLKAEQFTRFPHQLSGGQKQCAMLAMALSCDPTLLILDEPTSGLDALTRRHILALLRRLRRERQMSLIIISHNLQDLVGLTERTLVLYAGSPAELGATSALLDDPRHPYSWGLIKSYPRMDQARDLWGIRGQPPNAQQLPSGCTFHPRCTQAVERCMAEVPPLEAHNGRWLACHLGGLQTLLEVRGVQKRFPGGVAALCGADLRVREGELVALIGQTGSGKSTLARILVGLHTPDLGSVHVQGRNLLALRGNELRVMRQRIQLIFQDPYEALSPQLTVLELVREPLDIQQLGDRAEREARARAALAAARLPMTPTFLSAYSHQLSGGQLQRLAIARALVLNPRMLIADEPVAMLDPSEQARLLRLLKEVQNEYGMGMLLISHDLPLVRKVADRIAVLHAGQVVEEGPAHQVLNRPTHPYTRTLLEAVALEATDV